VGLIHLQPQLEQWRNLAADHNTSFFAFTIVREPVAHAVSFFNFYHLPPCLFAPDLCALYPLLPPTDQAVKLTAKFNYQCLYLARDSWDSFPHSETNATVAQVVVTAQECQSAYQVMRSELDWVGTTERLANNTLPLLWYMLAMGENWESSRSPPLHWKRGMEGTKPLALTSKSLQPSTVDYLQSLSQYDQSIYNSVQRDFSADMWEDFALL